MRVMTIFNLAAKTDRERQLIFRTAARDAWTDKLTAADREVALKTLANIARRSGFMPQPATRPGAPLIPVFVGEAT